MTIDELLDVLKLNYDGDSLALDNQMGAGVFSCLFYTLGGDRLTLSNSRFISSETSVTIYGTARPEVFCEGNLFHTTIICELDKNKFVYSVKCERIGNASILEIFGELPDTYMQDDKHAAYFPCVFYPLSVSCLSFSFQVPERSEQTQVFATDGIIEISKDAAYWNQYAMLFQQNNPFKGTTVFQKTGNGTNVQYIPHLDFNIPLHIVLKPYHRMIFNQMSVSFCSHVKIDDDIHEVNEISTVSLFYNISLNGVEQMITLKSVLFQGGIFWTFSASFIPMLTVESVVKILYSFFMIDISVLPVPSQMPLLNLFGLEEIIVSFDSVHTLKELNTDKIDALSLSVGSNTEIWQSPIPYFHLQNLNMSWEFYLNPLADGESVLIAGALSGTVMFELPSGFRLVIYASAVIPSFDIHGSIFLEDIKEKDEDYSVCLDDFTEYFGFPYKTDDNLTLASLDIYASPNERYISFELTIGEVWSFLLLNHKISIRDIYGGLTVSTDTSDFWLSGHIYFEAKKPFAIRVEISHIDKTWYFAGTLAEGEISITDLLKAIFYTAPKSNDKTLFEISLTKLWVEFTKTEEDYLYLDAALMTKWQTVFFSIPMSLYGEVELSKVTGHGTEGVVTVIFSINAFQIMASYHFMEAGKQFIFRIQWKQVFLQAVYELEKFKQAGEEKKHEVLTLTMGGTTLGGILESFVNLINPNLDFHLSQPWDVLNQISLERFLLKFDMTEKVTYFLYHADLNIAGLIRIEDIGLRYQSKVKEDSLRFILTGGFLEKNYTIGEPLSWDAISEAPPKVPGKNDTFRIHFFCIGNHFANERISGADTVEEALRALEEGFAPKTAAAELRYDESAGWSLGIHFTLLNALDGQLVFQDPAIYGILLTVSANDHSFLGMFSGLRLELLYKKVTEDIGMFKVTLQMPERWRTFTLGWCTFRLGIMSLEIYTNGNFKIDLGFPYQEDFSRSFVIEAGIYTGRGGLYFGYLSGETSDQVPAASNGSFAPVIVIGVGLALGLGHSFDFGIIRAGAYLQAYALFEGVFAVFHPNDESQPEAVYYYAAATVGIVGEVYLDIDLKIIAISAAVRISASVSAVLESYRPLLLAVDLELKLRASIKILFIKISFSLQFHLHLDFSVGSAGVTPWIAADGGEERKLVCLRTMGRARLKISGEKSRLCLCAMTDRKETVSLYLVPGYTVIPEREIGRGQVVFLLAADLKKEFPTLLRLAGKIVMEQTGGNGQLTAAGMKKALETLEESQTDYWQLLLPYVRFLIAAADKMEDGGEGEDGAVSGAAVPMLPCLSMVYSTFEEGEESPSGRVEIDFSGFRMVDEAYIQMLSDYFDSLKPRKEETERRREAGISGRMSLAQAVFNDYFETLVKCVLEEGISCAQKKTFSYTDETLLEVCAYFNRITGQVTECFELPDRNVEAALFVTEESVLKDNPGWRLKTDRLTFESLVYRVKGGDTLKGICEDYGISVPELADRSFLERRRLLNQEAVFSFSDIFYRTEGMELTLLETAAVYYVRLYGILAGYEKAAGDLQRSVEEGRYGLDEYLAAGTVISLDAVGGMNGRMFWYALNGDTIQRIAMYCRFYEEWLDTPSFLSFYGRLEELNPGGGDLTEGYRIEASFVPVAGDVSPKDLLYRLYPGKSMEDVLGSPDASVWQAPVWKESMQFMVKGGTVTGLSGLTVEEVLAKLGVGEKALAAAMGNSPGLMEEEDLHSTAVPVVTDNYLMERIAKEDYVSQTAAAVSRFFLDGLRIPVPGTEIDQSGSVRQKAAGEGSSRREKCSAMAEASVRFSQLQGLYGLTGQQQEADPVEGGGNFLRHRAEFTVKAPESGQAFRPDVLLGKLISRKGGINTLETGDGASIVMDFYNHALLENLPDGTLQIDYVQPLSELPLFETRMRTYDPAASYAYRDSVIHGFSDEAADRISLSASSYIGLAAEESRVQPLTKSVWCCLLELEVRKTDAGEDIFEIGDIGYREREYLYRIKEGREEDIEELRILYSSSPVEETPDGYLDGSGLPESTYLIKTNLSLETRSSRETGLTDTDRPDYTADFSQKNKFLTLLWESSVINSGGYYLVCRDREGKTLPDHLFDEHGKGKAALLVTYAKEAAGSLGVNGLWSMGSENRNKQVFVRWAGDEVPDEELVREPVLKKEEEGFFFRLKGLPEEWTGEEGQEKKDWELKQLYHIAGYQMIGNEYYASSPASVPLIPQEDGKGKPDGPEEPESQLYKQIIPVSGYGAGDGGYTRLGRPFTVATEFRDIYGNTAPGSGQQLVISPVYHDELLSLSDVAYLHNRYTCGRTKLCWYMENSFEQLFESGVGRKTDIEKETEDLELLLEQMNGSGKVEDGGGDIKARLHFSLMEEERQVELEQAVSCLKNAGLWLCWAGGQEEVKAGYLAPTLEELLFKVCVDYEAFGTLNQEQKLESLFQEMPEIPVTYIWKEGDSLAAVAGALPEIQNIDWEENTLLALKEHVELNIGRRETVTHKGETVEETAFRLNCSIHNLAVENRENEELLIPGTVFEINGYEVMIPEDGTSYCLADICETYNELFQEKAEENAQENSGTFLVTEEELLVSKKDECIFRENVSITFSGRYTKEGETLQTYGAQMDAAELAGLNFDTVNLFAAGESLLLPGIREALPNGSLQENSLYYDLTAGQILKANRGKPLTLPSELKLPCRFDGEDPPKEISVRTGELFEAAGIAASGKASAAQIEEALALWAEQTGAPCDTARLWLVNGRRCRSIEPGIPLYGDSYVTGPADTLENLLLLGMAHGAPSLEVAYEMLKDVLLWRLDFVLLLPPAAVLAGSAELNLSSFAGLEPVIPLEASVIMERTKNLMPECPEKIRESVCLLEPKETADEFAMAMETAFPGMKIAVSEDKQSLSAVLFGSRKLPGIKVGPYDGFYGEGVRSPRFYALRPLNTKLVSRENVRIAPLLEDGTLSEERTALSFAGVDMEDWALEFLYDVEDTLLPQRAKQFYEMGEEARALLNSLIAAKEDLSGAIVEGLCDVLETVSAAEEAQAGLSSAKEILRNRLRASLTEGYGSQVIAQYQNYGTASCGPVTMRLAGAAASMNTALETVEAGKIRADGAEGFVNLVLFPKGGSQARLDDPAFSYQVKELEYGIVKDAASGYERSKWLDFLYPVNTPKEKAEGITLDFSSDIPVPLPIRGYPDIPVCTGQSALYEPELEQLLYWDYAIEYVHRPMPQDTVCFEFSFNDRRRKTAARDEDLFQAMAQYHSQREALQGKLLGMNSLQALESMVSMAGMIAGRWKTHFEPEAAVADAEIVNYRLWISAYTEEKEENARICLRVRRLEKPDDLEAPAISLIDENGEYLEFSFDSEAGLYVLNCADLPDLRQGMCLEIRIKDLFLYRYQYASATVEVKRNYDLMESGKFAMNQEFLYETPVTAFTDGLAVFCQYDKKLNLREENDGQEPDFEKAFRTVFSKLLRLDDESTPVEFSFEAGYSYTLTKEEDSPRIMLPVCFRAKGRYQEEKLTELAWAMDRWYHLMNPSLNNRRVGFHVTVYSDEWEGESRPILELSDVSVGKNGVEAGTIGLFR